MITNFKPMALGTQSLQQEFIELETQWMNAWKTKDETTVRKLIADEFTLTSSLSSGELITKEKWIEKALHEYDCHAFAIDKLHVRTYGQTAVLNIWFNQNASANGKDWSGDFLITDVWIEKNDNWQVVARHASWLQKK